MKGDLKLSPVDVLWIVSSRNGTDNNNRNGKDNNRNGKVGKNCTFLQYWGGGLEFERGAWGEDFGFLLGVQKFGGGGLS